MRLDHKAGETGKNVGLAQRAKMPLSGGQSSGVAKNPWWARVANLLSPALPPPSTPPPPPDSLMQLQFSLPRDCFLTGLFQRYPPPPHPPHLQLRQLLLRHGGARLGLLHLALQLGLQAGREGQPRPSKGWESLCCTHTQHQEIRRRIQIAYPNQQYRITVVAGELPNTGQSRGKRW